MTFNLGLKRRRIEDRISDLAARVEVQRRDAAWLDGEQFWDYIYAWYDLYKYYETSQDTAIGAHLLRQYTEFASLLRVVMEDRKVNLKRRERAQSALMELNYQVDNVIHQVERNVHGEI